MKEMLDYDNTENTNDSLNKEFTLEEKASFLKEYKKQYKIPIRPTAIYKKNPIGQWQTELRHLASNGTLELSSSTINDLIDLEILPEDGFVGSNKPEENIDTISSNDANIPDVDFSDINIDNSIDDEISSIDKSFDKDDLVPDADTYDFGIDLTGIERNDIDNTNDDEIINYTKSSNLDTMPNILDYTDAFVEHGPDTLDKNMENNTANSSDFNFSEDDLQKYNDLDFLDLNKRTKFLLSKIPEITSITDLIALKQSGELLSLLQATKGIGQKSINEIIPAIPDSYKDFSRKISQAITEEENLKNQKTYDIIDGIPVEAKDLSSDAQIEEPVETSNELSNPIEDTFDLSDIDLTGIDLSDIHEEVAADDLKIKEQSDVSENSNNLNETEDLNIDDNISENDTKNNLNDIDFSAFLDNNLNEDIQDEDFTPESNEVFDDNTDDNIDLNLDDTDEILSDKEDDFEPVLDTNLNTDIQDEDITPEANEIFDDLNTDDTLNFNTENSDNESDLEEIDLQTNDEPIIPEDNEISVDDDFSSIKPLNDNYISFSDNETEQINDNFNSFITNSEEFKSENTNEASISYLENLKSLTSQILDKADQIAKYKRNLPTLQSYLYKINTIRNNVTLSEDEKKEKINASLTELDNNITRNNNDEKALRQEINSFLDSF